MTTSDWQSKPQCVYPCGKRFLSIIASRWLFKHVGKSDNFLPSKFLCASGLATFDQRIRYYMHEENISHFMYEKICLIQSPSTLCRCFVSTGRCFWRKSCSTYHIPQVAIISRRLLVVSLAIANSMSLFVSRPCFIIRPETLWSLVCALSVCASRSLT